MFSTPFTDMDVLTYKYETLLAKLSDINKDDEVKKLIIEETQKEVEKFIAEEVKATG